MELNTGAVPESGLTSAAIGSLQLGEVGERVLGVDAGRQQRQVGRRELSGNARGLRLPVAAALHLRLDRQRRLAVERRQQVPLEIDAVLVVEVAVEPLQSLEQLRRRLLGTADQGSGAGRWIAEPQIGERVGSELGGQGRLELRQGREEVLFARGRVRILGAANGEVDRVAVEGQGRAGSLATGGVDERVEARQGAPWPEQEVGQPGREPGCGEALVRELVGDPSVGVVGLERVALTVGEGHRGVHRRRRAEDQEATRDRRGVAALVGADRDSVLIARRHLPAQVAVGE